MLKKIIILSMLFIGLISCTASAEEEMTENSFRYENGVPIEQVNPNENDIRLFSTEEGIKGIDVSTFQGLIDWEEVKNSGVEFAIIRCGYGDDFVQYDDAYWKRNADECTRLGIPFGVYIYSYAASISEAQSEASHVLRLVEGYDLSYPVFLDLEDTVVAACSNELIGEIADTFCSTLQKEGYMVGIYANTNWWNTKLTSDVFDNPTWHKWVADWRGYCGYEGEYSFWQYTSSGSVNGIGGNVDMNYGYRTFDMLGDVNGDGSINLDDVEILISLIASMNNTSQKWFLTVADIDGSGSVDISDAYKLERVISGEEDEDVNNDGDVNGDGVTDAGDAGLILRYDVGIVTLTQKQISAGDVNGDGVTDAGDAGMILRKDVGLVK